jgi:hypothetical protein
MAWDESAMKVGYFFQTQIEKDNDTEASEEHVTRFEEENYIIVGGGSFSYTLKSEVTLGTGLGSDNQGKLMWYADAFYDNLGVRYLNYDGDESFKFDLYFERPLFERIDLFTKVNLLAYDDAELNALRGVDVGVNYRLGVPPKPFTRSELAALLADRFNVPIGYEREVLIKDTSKENSNYAAIQTMIQNEMLYLEKGNFFPERPITKHILIVALVRIYGLPFLSQAENPISFEDVPKNAWYTPHVVTAVRHGLIQDGKKFSPYEGVSARQFSRMVKRFNKKRAKGLVPELQGL